MQLSFSSFRPVRHLRLLSELVYICDPVRTVVLYRHLYTEMSPCSLSFSLFLRERNPISTRIELASLGLAGMFWLGTFFRTRLTKCIQVFFSSRCLFDDVGVAVGGCRVLCFGRF